MVVERFRYRSGSIYIRMVIMMLMLFFGCVYIDNKFGLSLYLDYDLNSGDTDVYDDAVLVMLCRPLGQKRSNNYTWRRSSSLFG